MTAPARDAGRDPVIGKPSPARQSLRGDLLALGTAAIAVICCLGVSVVVAAGSTAVLGLAGPLLPAVALIGVVGWTAWYLVRHR